MFAALLAAVVLSLPGFTENPRLSEVASYAAGKPVVAYCTDYEGWRNSPAPGGSHGFSRWGTSDIYLSPNTCAVMSRPTGKPSRGFARTLLTLVHEAMHAKGIRNEAEADCAALGKIAEIAIVRYGFKSRSARLREVVGFAWEIHRARLSQYQGVC